MCLFSETDIPLVADKDIICYKHMFRISKKDPWITPFQHYVMHKNFEAIGEESIELCGEDQFYDGEPLYKISSGFIHTYSSLNGFGKFRRPENNAFFKCIIPKGTRYFISDSGMEYCSKQIIFKRKMHYFLGRLW